MSRRLPWAAQEAEFLVAAKPLAPVRRCAEVNSGQAASASGGGVVVIGEEADARAGLDGAREPLAAAELPAPRPGPRQVLIAVRACAVCRTDLHVVDGELPIRNCRSCPGTRSSAPSSRQGEAVDRFAIGDRVGVPWLGWTCGVCDYCRAGRENLCDRARFTGYQIDGGYAELTVADQRYCFAIPTGIRRRRGGAAAVRRADRLPHPAAGRRRASGSASTASAPPRTSWRRWRAIRAARSSPSPGRATPRRRISRAALGADWAGGSDEPPPEPLDAALIFAPVGALVPAALAATTQGRHASSAAAST